MTTMVQAPPAAPAHPEPEPGPRSRRWLLSFWAVLFVLFCAVHPGRATFETKLGVAQDPWKFLGDLGELWHDRAGFGGISDQYIGYAFPMLPYYGLTDLLQLPVWLAERLWMSIVVTIAFWGALRLAERLGAGTDGSRLLGAVAYALWPTFTIVVGSTSAAALPGAFLPWVLLPLTNPRTSARISAVRSALLIPFMGGVNAASTLASLLPVGLYLLSRPPSPRMRRQLAWWLPSVVLATAWWTVPLVLLGIHGENFLPYVESSQTTTETMSATETLRGSGNWVAYLHLGEAWLPAGWSVATSVVVIVCSALAAALGLAGLARRDIPERRWLVLTVMAAALITLAGYGGSLGAPFHDTVRSWLDGGLAPFRNIYKFQTGLALALVLGIAHLVGVAADPRGARPLRVRRYVPLIATILVLPGLAWPYLNGSILQPGSFQKLPTYWDATADWLKKFSPDSRALVVPATAHGIYTWGSPIDQPLDVLADSRWAQRDFVPFGTPGNRRAMDAVEQALMSGVQVPGLQDYLSRSGLHYVVVRGDLDPDQFGYVPSATVKRTLTESGYHRVTGFGPQTTGGRIAEKTPIQVEGLYPRSRAVEIYAPPTDAHRPGQAGLLPVGNTTQVSGGPEALLRLSSDPTFLNRPAVLTGDNHPGIGNPALRVAADGLRRADTRFGLLNTNTSYPYTPKERNAPNASDNPGEQPKQILPSKGAAHQTTADIQGARSVTASSTGNWLLHLPQFDPVNAFDDNPDTAWAEGSADSAKGEWIRIDFTRPTRIPATIRMTPLPEDNVRAAPTRVRVETDKGSATSPIQPTNHRQQIKSPPGTANWLRVTILDTQRARPGLTGAGFSSIDIPGVRVTRALKLPTDSDQAEQFSFHRPAGDGSLTLTDTETSLNRVFTTTGESTYTFKATASALPSPALDTLLYEVAPDQRRKITATADSTAALGLNTTPRNLTDGDLTTAWIAGDDPTIHLRWPDKQPVSTLVLPAAGGLSTRPEKVEISSSDGAAVAGVDENGVARFDPITTDRLDITVTKTAPLKLHNPVADEDLQLPLGLTEAYIPTLDAYRVKQPTAARTFKLPCGKGPSVVIDGTRHRTSASGTLRALTERRPITVKLCGSSATLALPAGPHTLRTSPDGPLTLTDITLTNTTATTEAPPTPRELTVHDWLGDRREVQVDAGEATYLTMYENANDGWEATLDGKKLTSLRLDGWQQAWLIPGGSSGTVKLSYAPARTYETALFASGAALLLLIALSLWRRHDTDEPTPDPPAPGWLLGTVALTAVGVVIAGPWAALVPALALLAWKRHALLVPIAFTAMAAAGVIASTAAGEPVREGAGAYSTASQLLALIALFAALVTIPQAPPALEERGPGQRPESATPSPEPRPFEAPTAPESETRPFEAPPALEERGPGQRPESATPSPPTPANEPHPHQAPPAIEARGPGQSPATATPPPDPPSGRRTP
ncbi:MULTISPECIES: alpha-(1-_3)-arabinofuranosyltransferase family protein [unclassified Streptomyces]|uniref:alpha-(1->3)-arabinofuranosyltransferase n=1 Tax=unclassified Streptomyces TaxID=2593676 RepID=UPI00278BFC89|nr:MULTISPECIES: alpha-(1->3)-arabinofuranosyltransferase family protein [unclassified Streptomyces]